MRNCLRHLSQYFISIIISKRKSRPKWLNGQDLLPEGFFIYDTILALWYRTLQDIDCQILYALFVHYVILFSFLKSCKAWPCQRQTVLSAVLWWDVPVVRTSVFLYVPYRTPLSEKKYLEFCKKIPPPRWKIFSKKSFSYSPLHELFLDTFQKFHCFKIFALFVQRMYDLVTAFG